MLTIVYDHVRGPQLGLDFREQAADLFGIREIGGNSVMGYFLDVFFGGSARGGDFPALGCELTGDRGAHVGTCA